MTTALVLSAASLCLCIFGFFFFRRYIERKTAARELLVDYRTEVYRLIAEIDAAADRDSLLVEERIKTLKKIIDDTDRRISVYMRELQRSRAGEAMYASLGRGIRAALDSRPDSPEAEPLPESSASMEASSPAETMAFSETPITQKPPNSKKSPAKKNQPDSDNPSLFETPSGGSAGQNTAAGKRKPQKSKIKVQVAEMFAQGISPHDIASRLNLSLAEVDLAINLLKR
ncbi:MAG: hypothetical protein LBH20_08625 [Treponema sp.]|jgi:hypothetical protein|nr:hypothetical protein [Treponema sp.]